MEEDVLVQIEKFYVPIDFIVLNTEPMANPNAQILVILGRPCWLTKIHLTKDYNSQDNFFIFFIKKTIFLAAGVCPAVVENLQRLLWTIPTGRCDL